jgi:hypothetical protein
MGGGGQLIKKKIQHLVIEYRDGQEVRRFRSSDMNRLLREWTVENGYFVAVLPPTVGQIIYEMFIDLVNLMRMWVIVKWQRVAN